jgi:polygalacturonase
MQRLRARRGWTRRELIRAGALAAALPGCVFRGGSIPPPMASNAPRTTPWPKANRILATTLPPVFPARIFTVESFGARGKVDDTAAFARAIAVCADAGGGRVLVPAGTWSVGSLRLRSNVELHLERGATLSFSDDPSLYPEVFTRYEGIECINRAPPVYAFGETNVALTGEGTLDASKTSAWNRGSDREGVLEPLVARGVPAEERRATGRLRTSFVQLYRCKNVLIQGVTLRGASFWQLHPVLCDGVVIDGVTTRVSGPNTDGCDPESCRRVVIRSCTFASGDDNIALKSGRDQDGRRLATPCEDVVILHCQAEGRYGFICLGSELSGGIRNVYAHDNWTFGRGVGEALWIKANSRRGGFVDGVHLDGFRGAGFRNAVVRVAGDYDGQKGSFPPRFGTLELSHFEVSDAPRVFELESAQIGPVIVRDSAFTAIADERQPPGVRFQDVSINGKTALTTASAGRLWHP